MNRQNAKFKFTMVAVILTAVLSCVPLKFIWARYSSTIEGNYSDPTAKFIVEIQHDEGQENLQLTPSPNGSFTAFEFTVSNASGSSVSEVSQMFAVGLLVDKDTVISMSEMGNLDINLLPILVCTDNTEGSTEEILNAIYGFVANGAPPSFEFAIFQNFQIIALEGDYNQETIAENESVTFTWLYNESSDFIYADENSERDEIGGNIRECLETPSNGDFILFNFNKKTAGTVRFFLVFFAQGLMPVGQSFDFTNIQVVVYTEQTLGGNAS